MKNRLRSMFIAAVLVGTVVAGSFTAPFSVQATFYQQRTNNIPTYYNTMKMVQYSRRQLRSTGT